MKKEDVEKLRNRVLWMLIAVALVLSLVALRWGGQEWGDVLLNMGSELAGAAVTYFLLERVVGRLEEAEAKREAEEKKREAEKAELIAQMGSEVHDEAIRAVEKLRRRGWLLDGSLREARLEGASLVSVWKLAGRAPTPGI